MSSREAIVLVRGHIGELVSSSEAEPKATGLFAYATDLHVEGMLWGATVRSPHPHARIRGIDVAAALATEGVEAVLTSADVPGRQVYGIEVADQPVLASDVVRYAGEPVAVIAAVDAATAWLAAGLVAVDYELLEPAVDPAAGDVLHAARIRYGEPVAEADVVVSGTYEVGMQDQGVLGPSSALAIPAEDGGIDLHVATRLPEGERDQVCAVLSLAPALVRVHPAGAGGTFGGREDAAIAIHACLLAVRAKRPVQMTYRGDEAFRAHVHRHAAWLRYEHGATRDGELVYVKADVLLDGGAYTSSSPAVVSAAACFAAGPYRVRSAEIDVRATCTSTPPCGALPGFGAVQVAVAHEAQMDRLAAQLELDPLELRLRNALVAGDRLVTGEAIAGAVPVRELLERLRAMPIPPVHRTSPVDLRELPGGMSNSTHGEDVARGVGYAVGFRNAATGDAPAPADGVTLCFAAHRAVCDVDLALGLVRVVEVAAAQDVGRIANVVQCEARVQGGISQGLGLALMEELHVADGIVRTTGFTDYLIPTILDMPPVRMELLETQPEGAGGLSGIGEPPAIASTPAIAAALRTATGRPVTRVPVRPDDLLAEP